MLPSRGNLKGLISLQCSHLCPLSEEFCSQQLPFLVLCNVAILCKTDGITDKLLTQKLMSVGLCGGRYKECLNHQVAEHQNSSSMFTAPTCCNIGASFIASEKPVRLSFKLNSSSLPICPMQAYVIEHQLPYKQAYMDQNNNTCIYIKVSERAWLCSACKNLL